MFVILAYDIKKKGVGKAMKICRKYLAHVQNSLFEGSISESKLKKLKGEIEKVVDVKCDVVCIYKFGSTKYSSKEQIGMIPVFSNLI